MYQEKTPPAEVLEAMAEDRQRALAADEKAAGAALDADLAALTSAGLEVAAKADPAASRALDRITRAMAALPEVKVDPLEGLSFREGPLRPQPSWPRWSSAGARSRGRVVCTWRWMRGRQSPHTH